MTTPTIPPTTSPDVVKVRKALPIWWTSYMAGPAVVAEEPARRDTRLVGVLDYDPGPPPRPAMGCRYHDLDREACESFCGQVPCDPRTLDQIVSAVRSGGEATVQELREAVAAFDVCMAQLRVSEDQRLLVEYVRAAESAPAEYLGEANHPDSKQAREWYVAMLRAGD